MMRSTVTFLFLIAAILAPRMMFATTILHLDLPDLVKASEIVVKGKVGRVQSRSTEDGMLLPFTEITLIPEIIYKSHVAIDEDASIVIRTLGSQSKGRALHVAGTGKFKVGEEVVVFLEATSDSYFILLGMAQGKYDIYKDHKTGLSMVARQTQGLHRVAKPLSKAIIQGIVQGTSDNHIPLHLLETIIENNIGEE